MNVIVPWLKWRAVPLNHVVAFISQKEGAFKDADNLHHRVKIGICDTVGEM